MKSYLKFVLTVSIILLIIVISCSIASNNEEKMPLSEGSIPNDFKSYWHQGKAEVNHYQLTQARYGELRDSSEAVLIFVTEDFLSEKQVKADLTGTGIPILKLNFIKRFVTGIYDYSMMNSVFTPVNRKEFPVTLKLTSSSQDWCGQTFMQMNFKNNQYQISSLSYFESDGDDNYSLDKTFLEDEIYALIRISPDNLPQGKIKMIPGAMQSRLRHKKLAVENVDASIEIVQENNEINLYRLSYVESNRTLQIFFKKKFPYQITGWEETYKDGVGDHVKDLTTKATLLKTVYTDYWMKNTNVDIMWRDSLQLKKTF